jgi:hypothetical protein
LLSHHWLTEQKAISAGTLKRLAGVRCIDFIIFLPLKNIFFLGCGGTGITSTSLPIVVVRNANRNTAPTLNRNSMFREQVDPENALARKYLIAGCVKL